MIIDHNECWGNYKYLLQSHFYMSTTISNGPETSMSELLWEKTHPHFIIQPEEI
jgi:hypothetical protein